MGTGSKVVSVFLRLGELCSAAIVAGLVGEYLHYVSNAHDHAPSRMVYTIALAGISMIVALVCIIPLEVLFFGFILDAALFVMWMVSFGLLANLTGSGGCNSGWYYSSWGYYWGGWYTFPTYPGGSVIGTTACGKWRATLAWTFIGGIIWLASAILGAYVISRRHDRGGERDGVVEQNSMTNKRASAGTEELSMREGPETRAVNSPSVV